MSRWAAAQVAAALLLLASMPLPAASQDAAIAEVPEACKMVHIEDYKNDLPTVMGNGSTTDASCPDDASICSLACKQAIQRLDADCVAYVRGPDWLTKMLTTCKMQLHEVNPCAAKNVTVQSQQQYGPNLKSCPVLANQTCSCNADFSCVRALYELGSRCAKYLGFSYGPFTPTDTEWTDLYAKCNMSIGDFERGFVPPCSSGDSSAVTVAAVAAGAVAGIVVGVVLVLAAMVGGYMCYRRRQQRKSLLAQGPSKGYPSGMMITTGAACPSDGWTATGGFAAAGSASRGAPAARAPAPLYSVPPLAAHSGGVADPGQCTGRDHDSAQSLDNDPLHQFLKAKRLVFPGGSQAAALPTAGASRDTATSSVAVSSQHSGSTAGTAATAVATPSRRSMAGVSVQPWEIAYQDLLLLEECGEGSFGRVYRAQWHEAEVAAKVLLTEGSSKRRAASIPTQALAKLEAEASLLASLRHPNVVSFYGICRDPPCIITEYCANGSLTDTLAAAREAPPVAALLTWPRRLAMALDAAKGMLYLHNRSPPIIHRDLKSPNLLVDRHMTIKVTDFNLSRILEDEGASQTSSMAVMNPRWLAPEVMQGLHATPAADVFSFGVVLWELLTWQMPFADMRNLNNWQLATLVVRGQRLEIPPRDELPGADTPSFQGLEDYVALLQRCWAAEPADRPSFQHVVQKLRALLDQSTAVHSASIAGSAASRGRQGAAVCTSGSGSL